MCRSGWNLSPHLWAIDLVAVHISYTSVSICALTSNQKPEQNDKFMVVGAYLIC